MQGFIYIIKEGNVLIDIIDIKSDFNNDGDRFTIVNG